MAPNLIPTEIVIIIIIDIYTMIEEDRLVAIRYDAPLDKALEPTNHSNAPLGRELSSLQNFVE